MSESNNGELVVEFLIVKFLKMRAPLKALEMKMQKLIFGLSVAEILPEEINKMLSLKNLGFIDAKALKR